LRIAVLTSSRADFGIYLPLLKVLREDSFFEVCLLVFGTHLSDKHGRTVNEIISYGFTPFTEVDTMPDGDSPAEVSAAMGKTMLRFSNIWQQNSFDLVVALGDRFEMFAACASAVPFGVPIAHIHGGETTLGAIDDVFRNSITQMASYHFTTTEIYREKVVALKGSANNVFNVGALSIDNIKALSLLNNEQFKERFQIDLSVPTILITFHPETVAFGKNEKYISEIILALNKTKGYQYLITMPNADTMGTMIRTHLLNFVKENKNAIAVESFGALGYLSAMKLCTMMLGNTSSGFVEAASFPKYVINLGKRQEGRIVTPNIYNCEIRKEAICNAIANFNTSKLPEAITVYGNGETAKTISAILKRFNRD
jgi:GDP/UDP-N,N'-diacetylbacillosamine 2-epimerase (hydrolysing)